MIIKTNNRRGWGMSEIIAHPGKITQEKFELVRCRNCGKRVKEDNDLKCCNNPDIEKITRHVLKITEKLPIFDGK